MQAQGMHLVKHYRETAFMGFAEVARNLRTILGLLDLARSDLQAYAPDVLLLIDYPGFNLRMARYAHALGIRVVYYISTLMKTIDRMLVILPFEQAFYRKWGWEVDYVGHPLLEEIARRRADPSTAGLIEKGEGPLVALLPGSRKQEIRQKLPVMLEAAKRFPECRFIIAQAPGLEDAFLDTFVAGHPNVGRVKGATYALLMKADAALVTSGTATLETALFGVPEVVCYKGGTLSFLIARRLVQVDHISLVNLILAKPLLTELIQHQCTPQAVQNALQAILDGPQRAAILAGYQELGQQLGDVGAAERTARGILQELQQPDRQAW